VRPFFTSTETGGALPSASPYISVRSCISSGPSLALLKRKSQTLHEPSSPVVPRTPPPCSKTTLSRQHHAPSRRHYCVCNTSASCQRLHSILLATARRHTHRKRRNVGDVRLMAGDSYDSSRLAMIPHLNRAVSRRGGKSGGERPTVHSSARMRRGRRWRRECVHTALVSRKPSDQLPRL
jgi:hypothetical protein